MTFKNSAVLTLFLTFHVKLHFAFTQESWMSRQFLIELQKFTLFSMLRRSLEIRPPGVAASITGRRQSIGRAEHPPNKVRSAAALHRHTFSLLARRHLISLPSRRKWN